MPDENLQQPEAPADIASPPRKGGFRLPADYYSTPPERRVIPRGVTFGCGIAGAVAILLIFAIGGYLATGGFSRLIVFGLDQNLSEMRAEYAGDVTAPQKAAFEKEMETLIKKVEAGKLPIASLERFLNEILAVRSDKLARAEEVERLTKMAHDLNAKAKP